MTMTVLVLHGTHTCHIEVFEDSERGAKKAEKRKSKLQSMNTGWKVTVERYRIQ